MVVLLNRYGNHSNRLFQTIHLEAFCLENGIKYLNARFFDLVGIYQIKDSRTFLFVVYCFLKVLTKTRLLEIHEFDEYEPDKKREYETILMSGKSKLVVVSGTAFRSDDLTRKYRRYFIDKYGLQHRDLDDDIFKVMNDYQIKVGVHIRRTDYRWWCGGKYFYADDIYRSYVYKVKNEFPDKSVVFILFSDEKIDPKNIVPSGINYFVSHKSYFMDHLIMSKCDLLIGPPSTFTNWASYIGCVRCFHINDPSVEFCGQNCTIHDG